MIKISRKGRKTSNWIRERIGMEDIARSIQWEEMDMGRPCCEDVSWEMVKKADMLVTLGVKKETVWDEEMKKCYG